MQLAFEDHGFKTVVISIDNIVVSNRFNVVRHPFAIRIRSHARFGIQTILNSDMQPWVRSKEYPVIFVKNVKYPQSWRRMLPEAELSLDCAACIRILN